MTGGGAGWDLAGQVAVVTGGAHGFGRRHGHRMAALGAQVVLADVDEAAVESAAAGMDGALGLPLDVCNEHSAGQVVDSVLDRYGHIDILVNNAGAARPRHGTQAEQFRAIVDLNLNGTALMCDLVAPHMIKRGIGRIVNTASNTVFHLTRDVSPAYVAAKAGVVALTRQLALELGGHGITVNAVAQGFVGHADMNRKLDPQTVTSMTQVAAARQSLPRPGTEDDITSMVLFLVGPESTWITGQVFVVDGGLSFP